MIRNIFEEIQAPCEKLLVNSLSDTRQMYGIFIGDDKKKTADGSGTDLSEDALGAGKEKWEFYLTIGVSRCRSQLEGKETSEARQALKQRIIYGKANIYFYEDIRILGEQEIPSVSAASAGTVY